MQMGCRPGERLGLEALPTRAKTRRRTNQIIIARRVARRLGATPAPRGVHAREAQNTNQAPWAALWRAHAIDAAAATRAAHSQTRSSGSDRRGSPIMAQTAADAFDYSAINIHMAKQLTSKSPCVLAELLAKHKQH